MKAKLHVFLVILSTLLAWWLVRSSAFIDFLPQIAGGCLLIYFFSRVIKNRHIFGIDDQGENLEMFFLSLGVTLLISSTGNTASIFFPLIYIHIFLIVLTFELENAIFLSVLLFGWHSFIFPNLSAEDMAKLLSLPILLGTFIFARIQLNQKLKDEQIIKKQEGFIAKEDNLVKQFILDNLLPNLDKLESLLDKSKESQTNFSTALTAQIKKIKDLSLSFLTKYEA